MRTIIYARYSSDLQNSRSIDDQIAVCQDRARREGWTVVDVFTDAAISGAAGVDETQRPGLSALMRRLESGNVDQVLAESTSRIARDEGDSFKVRRWFKFHNVRLFTLSDGEVDDFRGSVRALIDSQQRRDTAANVRRGQIGTVKSGRIAAGLAYGYRLANQISANGELLRGLREVDEDKSEIVRRIFSDYSNGVSPKAIAETLNAEGIASPSGGKWTASTILGDTKRGNGILKNAIYIGRIVHNRTSKVMHPETRRDIIRPKELDERVEGNAPHLRIIDDALWARVQAQIESRSGSPRNHQRRPKKLLSGLIRCGACGATMILAREDYWSCGGARAGKGCTNSRKVANHLVEQAALSGLQEGLVDPDVVDGYLQEYAQRRSQRAREIEREHNRLHEAHADAARKVERLVEAIANGADEFVEVRDMIRRARQERDELKGQLASVDELRTLALHPGVARSYREQVASLSQALGDPFTRAEVVPQIRALIDTIIATPREDGRGLAIHIEGSIVNILKFAAGEPIEALTPPPQQQLRKKG